MLISTSLQHLAKTLPIGEAVYQSQPSSIITFTLRRMISSSGVTGLAWKARSIYDYFSAAHAEKPRNQ
jgi:hypothetical protein